MISVSPVEVINRYTNKSHITASTEENDSDSKLKSNAEKC
jgi:hypothetical protein